MAPNIQDRNNELEAERKFVELLPDPKTRRIYLSMFADAIIEANYQKQDNWSVTNSIYQPDIVRLQFGHYIVFSMVKERIWLALDKELAEHTIGEFIPLTFYAGYGWETDRKYPHYKNKFKQPFSINGTYTILSEACHQEAWSTIRRLHLDFLYKVKHIGYSMHQRTKEAHLPCVVQYLRSVLEQPVPDPVYS